MSDTPDDGGSAFPTRSDVDPRGETVWGEAGMTLRDYFAGLAMQGQIASFANEEARAACRANAAEECITAKERVARAAYEYADAMLKARKT